MAYRNWTIRGIASTGRIPLNDEVYNVVDTELGSIIYQTAREKDARLICREIVANIARHDVAAFRVTLIISKVAVTNIINIEIIHDGNTYDQLHANSDCLFLKSLCSRLGAQFSLNINAPDKTYTISIP